MKLAMIIGLVLILPSVVAFAYKGITYTTREKTIEIGPIDASVVTNIRRAIDCRWNCTGYNWTQESKVSAAPECLKTRKEGTNSKIYF